MSQTVDYIAELYAEAEHRNLSAAELAALPTSLASLGRTENVSILIIRETDSPGVLLCETLLARNPDSPTARLATQLRAYARSLAQGGLMPETVWTAQRRAAQPHAYAEWLRQAKVVEGVRMGPRLAFDKLPPNGLPL